MAAVAKKRHHAFMYMQPEMHWQGRAARLAPAVLTHARPVFVGNDRTFVREAAPWFCPASGRR